MKKTLLVILVWALVWVAAYILNLFNNLLIKVSQPAGFGYYCYGFLLSSVIVVPISLMVWEEWENKHKS